MSETSDRGLWIVSYDVKNAKKKILDCSLLYQKRHLEDFGWFPKMSETPNRRFWIVLYNVRNVK